MLNKIKNLPIATIMAVILMTAAGASIVYAGVGIIVGKQGAFNAQVTNINLSGLNWNVDQFGTLNIQGINWTYAKMQDAQYGNHSGVNWQSLGV